LRLKKEAEYFMECLLHPQREAMIHIFFGERAASKIADVPKDTPVMDIKKAGIIGSGTMGGGIAMCFANAGIPVHIIDQDEDNLKRGMSVIEKNYDFMVGRGKLTSDQKEAVFGLISSSLDYKDLHDCDIAIEAVYENLDLKMDIFKSLDEHVKPGAILASNTSGLDIDAIASVTDRPELVVGTHFFSPANIMRLLEVVRGEKTSNETLATRIMWLDGLEDGKNKGKGVDSYNRYIYIHGTHEEGLIGQKASHGCIRMFNSDVIELFNVVKKGTKVYIRA
jgi:3-hydroxyacyl-CoA dehydrogenase